MVNERKTEELVRQLLKANGYKKPGSDLVIEEQASEIEIVRKLLLKASKTGGGGRGAPEFIVSSPSTPDFLIVIECKAETRSHQSKNGDNPVSFALDGALHYSKYLSTEFNVIAIAVSGQNKSELKTSTYLQVKGDPIPKPFGEICFCFLGFNEDFLESSHCSNSVTSHLKFRELMAMGAGKVGSCIRA